MAKFDPGEVLDFWFPDTGHEADRESHVAFWTERMQGGMDAEIIRRFAPLTEAAARGRLDRWADTARGRLALLIALDQFPRSLWRDTPAAYGQDIRAARLALEGIENGHWDTHRPWEQSFYVIAISHCEGPDHLARMRALDAVIERLIAGLPPHMDWIGEAMRDQHAVVTSVIERFGRHPHRNGILGRVSTDAERDYIERGEFPHQRRVVDAAS